MIPNANFYIRKKLDFFAKYIDSHQNYGNIYMIERKINEIILYFMYIDKDIFIFDQNNYKNVRENKHLNDQISQFISFIDEPFEIKDFYIDQVSIQKLIFNCLIKKSLYLNQQNIKERINFSKKANTLKEFNYDDFIELLTFTSSVHLYFNKTDHFPYILKSFDSTNEKSLKSFNNEKAFYEKVANQFPYFRRLFGTINHINNIYLVLQYIDGKTLHNLFTNNNKIDDYSKIRMIVLLSVQIYGVHKTNYIMRDLNLNNIIVDSKNNPFIIDFDSALLIDDNMNVQDNDEGSISCTSPERDNGEYTPEGDIYSLGLIIYFFFTEKSYFQSKSIAGILEEKKSEKSFSDFPEKYNYLKDICKSCLSIEPKNRPTINKLVEQLINNSIFNIEDDPSKNIRIIMIKSLLDFYIHPESRSSCDPYLNIRHFKCKDIDKAIPIFKLAAEKDDSDAQFYLGLIYYEETYGLKDVNQSIDYFTKSAKHKNSYACFYLGLIYNEGKYVKSDIEKSIYYFEISAEQDHFNAQFYLGLIYCMLRKINKSIYYLTKSAERNHQGAQCLLGNIYYYENKNYDKSIHYLKLSADQNFALAQYLLGKIYYDDAKVRDVEKAIHYLTLSAEQNFAQANYYLGVIYYDALYICRDINKSLNYLTSAVNLNQLETQSNLGEIYCENSLASHFYLPIHDLKNASIQNHSNALCYLGKIYLNYLNWHELAIQYFELSANNNNYEAQIKLGDWYFAQNDFHTVMYKILKQYKKWKHFFKKISKFFFKNQFFSHHILKLSKSKIYQNAKRLILFINNYDIFILD
ncbi:hypothetical protein M9Y10_006446 [Tritrichomonas musculus]|uniref:Protein kinase domain-containing protein n=1 Tax=Tritrichomonas musculus TaxID=1915356 RepID=A0ABR2JFP4_9EUKA